MCKPNKTPSKPLFDTLKWLTFENRCRYHAALIVFRSLINLTPNYINEMLSFSNNSKYNLRSAVRKDIMCIKSKSNYMKSSFKYFSMEVWNSIPAAIRSIKTVHAFKKSYKQHLLHVQLNS